MSDIEQAMWDTQQAALREPMKSIHVLSEDEAKPREKIACVRCPYEDDCKYTPTLEGRPRSGACSHALRAADRTLTLLYEEVEKITAASEHLYYSQTEGWKSCRDYVLALLKGGQS